MYRGSFNFSMWQMDVLQKERKSIHFRSDLQTTTFVSHSLLWWIQSMDWNMALPHSLPPSLSNGPFHSIVDEIMPVLRCNKVYKNQTTLKKCFGLFITFKSDWSYIQFSDLYKPFTQLHLDFYSGNTLSFHFILCDSISLVTWSIDTFEPIGVNFITLLVRFDLDMHVSNLLLENFTISFINTMHGYFCTTSISANIVLDLN